MTLVCLHGAGCTGAVFRSQLEAFPDLHAPQLPPCKTVEAFANAVVEYVERNRLSDVVMCGHSLGAMVAIETALRKPVWLRAIVAFGGGLHLTVAPAIFQMLETDFDAAAKRIAGYMFANRDDVHVAQIADSIRATGQNAVISAFRACDSYDVTRRAESIAVPLLALTGDQDRMTPPALAQALVDRVPGAQARIIAGAGHMVMLEAPGDTNDALRSFVSGLDPKAISF